MNTIGEWALWARTHSVIAMVAVFSLILLTTYWPSRKREIEAHARIVLDDEP